MVVEKEEITRGIWTVKIEHYTGEDPYNISGMRAYTDPEGYVTDYLQAAVEEAREVLAALD